MADAELALGDELSQSVRRLFRDFVAELAPLARPEMNATVGLELEIQNGCPVHERVTRTRKRKPKSAHAA